MTQVLAASPAPTAIAGTGRLDWLDASRVFAALGIIMIHCSADPAGNAFNKYQVGERVIPVLMRMVGEISGAELFMVFSLFILAMKVGKSDIPGYGPTVRLQAKRLLIPYAVWSLFYLGFRFVKADVFGYTGSLFNEIIDWKYLLQCLLMGSAQYHLHFLPTLFVAILFYPILKSAIRFPLIGLILLPLIFCMDTVQERIWALVKEPTARELLCRAVKDVCYIGYGFVAFSLFGMWRRGIPAKDSQLLFNFAACTSVIAFLTTLAYAGNVIATGMWVGRPGASLYAHLVMPALIFMVFLTMQNVVWSPVYGRIAKLNFGIYLVHPVFIDLYEIGYAKAGLNLSPGILVSTKYAFAVACAIGAAWLISKIRPLAWTIGVTSAPVVRGAPLAKMAVKIVA